MNLKGVVVVFSVVLGMGMAVSAEDLSGRWGIGGTGGLAIPVGGSFVRDEGTTGASAGAFIHYGVTPRWRLGLDYDNLSLRNDVRAEALNLAVRHFCAPDRRLTPVVVAGLGLGAGEGNKDFNDFAGKIGGGFDYFLTPNFSAGLLATYHFVSETGDADHVAHVINPALQLTYYFGRPGAVPAAAAAAPAASVPVSVAIKPSEATLKANGTQAFKASVKGAADKKVTWSLSPSLGSISSDGLYTAPTSIAFEENVTVTAVSQADGSQKASSVVHLQPAPDAAKRVSITLNVLFDTDKDVVKPEFRDEIQKVADFLKTYSRTKAEIAGHTDNTGDASYNVALSQRRADAVKKYLVDELGIEAGRLSAKGYGPKDPIADNGTAEGRAKNRRVVADIQSK